LRDPKGGAKQPKGEGRAPPDTRCGPTGATAHADFDTRPSSVRFAATFSQWEKDEAVLPES